jgi:hypothetical protein
VLVPVVRGQRSFEGSQSSFLVNAFASSSPPLLTIRGKIVQIITNAAGCFNTSHEV